MSAFRNWILAASFAALSTGALFVAAAAHGDEAPAPGPAPRPAGATRHAGPDRAYTDACARGNAKYAARDFAGAIDIYRGAIEKSPHEPLGYYLMGEAQLGAGSTVEASAAWNLALTESSRDPSMHARVLFVLADLKERQKQWPEAKAAWQAYLDWVGQASPPVAFPETAQARIHAIDRALQQDKAYDIVRTRIAETSDGGVYSRPDASSPK